MKNSIPRFALTLILLIISILNAFAQTGIEFEPIDKVVEAINSKNYETLKPYVLKETKVGNVAPQFTEAVLLQLLSQIGKVESVRLLKKVTEGANTRYFCIFKFSDKEREYDFLLNPDNKFLELNIVKAQVKKVTNQFNDEETSFPQKIEVPILLAKKHILVQAEINGKKGNFVFDSGAPTLILNQSYFKLPEGKAIDTGVTKGVSGSVNNLSYFKAQSFNWSGISFTDKDVATINLTHLEKALGEKEILGLIGYSVIEKYAVMFDYKAKKLTLDLADSIPQTSEKPFFSSPILMRGHLPIVEMEIKGKVLKFAVDSGAGSNLLDKKHEAEFSSSLKNTEKDTLIGADNNPQTVTKGILKKAVLGGKLVFKDMTTVFSDISHINKGNDIQIEGILGYEFLRQYKTVINFKTKLIEFYK